MRISRRVKKILAGYESDSPGTKANLARILMHGKLGGSGKLVILPVDQGFEHGPARSFAPNPPAYDPHYHFGLAIDAGLSAYAAPLGMIEAGAGTFAGAIPTILNRPLAGLLRSRNQPRTYFHRRGNRTMRSSRRVKKILAGYESDSPGTKTNLARILMHGKLGGSGKLVILPVDQGFEHGPARSFAANPPAYDPHYHFGLAIDAGLSLSYRALDLLDVEDARTACLEWLAKRR